MSIIQYIKSFLLYDHPEAQSLIGYTRQPEEQKQFPLVIVPCENNILLGETDHWHTHWGDDIIYRTAYCLARIEELQAFDCQDPHDRFLYKNTHIEEAEIDKYSFELLDKLGLPHPTESFEEINLTHDIDFLSQYRHLRGFLGGVKRGEVKSIISSLKSLKNDPVFTFPWILEQDARVIEKYHTKTQGCKTNIQSIYFVKATDGKGYDYPQYDLQGKDFQALMELLASPIICGEAINLSSLGLHGSYYDKQNTSNIQHEKLRLEKALCAANSTFNFQLSTFYRTHYLRTLSPIDYQTLANIGITDDYTLGFADRAGFRLGTTRTTYYINPITLEVDTRLKLHPLTIMDVTLSNQQYMNLSEEEAYQECTRLIDLVKHYHGSLSLLWHNSNLTPNTYHKSLYTKLLDYLAQ